MYLEVSETTPFGPACPSPPRSYSFLSKKSGAHISSWLSLLNDSSSAPATVPVASNGSEAVGDHANVEVLWISLSFMIVVGVICSVDVEFRCYLLRSRACPKVLGVTASVIFCNFILILSHRSTLICQPYRSYQSANISRNIVGSIPGYHI